MRDTGTRLARLEGDEVPEDILKAAFDEWRTSPDLPSARTLRLCLSVELALVEMHMSSMPSNPLQLERLWSELDVAVASLDAGQMPDVRSIWQQCRELRGGTAP